MPNPDIYAILTFLILIVGLPLFLWKRREYPVIHGQVFLPWPFRKLSQEEFEKQRTRVAHIEKIMTILAVIIFSVVILWILFEFYW